MAAVSSSSASGSAAQRRIASSGRTAACWASGSSSAGTATGTPAASMARRSTGRVFAVDRTSTAISDHGTPSSRCARRSWSAIQLASCAVEDSNRTCTLPVPVSCGLSGVDSRVGETPGSRAASRRTAVATFGAIRWFSASTTVRPAPGSASTSSRGSAPRKEKIAWSGSPARTSSPVLPSSPARVRISANWSGSRCWASSTSRCRTRARSAASSSSSLSNASSALVTSSAASSAGPLSRPASNPASSVTSSYCTPNVPAATHSGTPCRSPSSRRSSGPSPRSAARSSRSRSSAAKPGSPSAGRSRSGQCGAPASMSPASSSRIMACCSGAASSRGGAVSRSTAWARSTANAYEWTVRTRGCRTVRSVSPCSPSASPVSSRVIRARMALAARRLAVSTSTFSGSAPPRSTRSAATSASSVVLPLPGPPSTLRNPPGLSSTWRAAADQRGRGEAPTGRRTRSGATVGAEAVGGTRAIEPRCSDSPAPGHTARPSSRVTRGVRKAAPGRALPRS